MDGPSFINRSNDFVEEIYECLMQCFVGEHGDRESKKTVIGGKERRKETEVVTSDEAGNTDGVSRYVFTLAFSSFYRSWEQEPLRVDRSASRTFMVFL